MSCDDLTLTPTTEIKKCVGRVSIANKKLSLFQIHENEISTYIGVKRAISTTELKSSEIPPSVDIEYVPKQMYFSKVSSPNVSLTFKFTGISSHGIKKWEFQIHSSETFLAFKKMVLVLDQKKELDNASFSILYIDGFIYADKTLQYNLPYEQIKTILEPSWKVLLTCSELKSTLGNVPTIMLSSQFGDSSHLKEHLIEECRKSQKQRLGSKSQIELDKNDRSSQSSQTRSKSSYNQAIEGMTGNKFVTLSWDTQLIDFDFQVGEKFILYIENNNFIEESILLLSGCQSTEDTTIISGEEELQNDNVLASSIPLCCGCKICSAQFIVIEDRLTLKSPSYLCRMCYHLLHYSSSGEKLYDFLVYPYGSN